MRRRRWGRKRPTAEDKYAFGWDRNWGDVSTRVGKAESGKVSGGWWNVVGGVILVVVG